MRIQLIACPKPCAKRKRARKPLKRSCVKPYNAKRKGSSFPKRRDYAFRQWVRANAPCILHLRYRPHRCNSPVRCCHIVNRARGGNDRRNIFGGCDAAHEYQHQSGSIAAFEERWGVRCQAEADRLDAAYVAQQGDQT